MQCRFKWPFRLARESARSTGSILCQTQPSHHHWILRSVAHAALLYRETVANIEIENLVETLYVRTIIEVFWNLLDALANHCSLNDVLRPHPASRHSCSTRPIATESMIDLVSWNLRARSEYLPDLEGALELNDLDRLH